MFKVISWFFNGTHRYRQTVKLYQKGLKGRLIVAFISILLFGCAIASEWWFYSFTSSVSGSTNYPILSIIGIGLLAIIAIATAIDFCVVHSYVAFRNAFWGTVITVASKMSARRKNKTAEQQVESIEVEDGKTLTTTGEAVHTTTITEAEGKKEKNYKALDIVIGVFEILLAIGVIAGIFLLGAHFVDKNNSK